MELIEFSIKNWDKFNPRKDRNNYTWFRFENTFFTDPQLFSLDMESKMLLIFIFCEASKSGSGIGKLNTGMVTALVGISPNKVMECIQHIENSGIASFGNHDTPKDTNVRPTNERTNERTNETNETNEKKLVFDFELAYSKFPNKKGKTPAFKKLKAIIKSEQDFSDLCTSIDNYSSEVKLLSTERAYMLHFSTFVGRFHDYLSKNGWERPQAKIRGSNGKPNFQDNYEKGMALLDEIRGEENE